MRIDVHTHVWPDHIAEAVLQGIFHYRRYRREDLRLAIDYFLQATELDPEFANAWSGLANTYMMAPLVHDSCAGGQRNSVVFRINAVPSDVCVASVILFGRAGRLSC